MVALQILVLSAQVRILVPQPKKTAFSPSFSVEVPISPAPPGDGGKNSPLVPTRNSEGTLPGLSKIGLGYSTIQSPIGEAEIQGLTTTHRQTGDSTVHLVGINAVLTLDERNKAADKVLVKLCECRERSHHVAFLAVIHLRATRARHLRYRHARHQSLREPERKDLFHYYSFCLISTMWKASMMSPSFMSLKFSIPIPHSIPAGTSFTESLPLWREDSTPV